MRLTLSVFAVLAIAGCQPDVKPVSATTASEPTLEELGQDDPSIPFSPAIVGPPRTYEASSKTAMSFTPGVLTLTPTPQVSQNAAPGAVFAFGNGYILEATLAPGAASDGETPFNFTKLILDPSGAPLDPSKIEIYGVDQETVPLGAPNGGFCEKTSFLATYPAKSPGAEDLVIAAFQGDQWPPKDDAALCGTFTYTLVR